MEEEFELMDSNYNCSIICALCDEVIKTVSLDEYCCRYSNNPFIVCPSCKAAWKAFKKEKSAFGEK